MYRIMIARSKKDNYATLYQYMTTTVDNVVSPLEFADKATLDAKVEKMLNDEGYAKDDFIIVQAIEYTVDAADYSDDESEDVTTDSRTDEGTSSDETV